MSALCRDDYAGGPVEDLTASFFKHDFRTAADGKQLCLFWGQASPFSNWRAGPLKIDGFEYNCGEQRMMHAKAAFFKDGAAADRCLDAVGPWEQKRIGRGIRGYVESEWERVRLEMMVELVWSKAMQDERVKAFLLDTGSSTIVEASPHDPVWGIGLGADDPRALDESQWQGRNLLGIAWMQARDLIRVGASPKQSECSAAVIEMYGPPEDELKASPGLKF